MDFTFSAEQRQSADMLAGVLGDICSLSHLRTSLKAGAKFDDGRWATLARLELAGIMVSERQGGLGLGAVDVVLLAQACGYAALPEGLAGYIGVTVPLLAELGCDIVLQAILAGGSYVAHQDHGFVVARDAAAASYGVVVDGDRVAVVAADALASVNVASIDPFRRLARLTLPAALQAAPAAIARARERGAVFAAAELVGIAQRAVDIAAAYAKERQQFGKPIGANQAVKHMLASAQVKIEFARPVVYAAAFEADIGSVASRARVSHAKLAAADAALAATRAALQVHGAIGYSWEADVHIFLKRALALSEEWGERPYHRARVQRRLTTYKFAPDTLFALETDHG